MSFLQKIFNREYKKIKTYTCKLCNSIDSSHKKCNSCSKRICIDCSLDDLCIYCNKEYEIWEKSLQNLKIMSTKQDKYCIKTQNNTLFSLI